MGWGAEEGRLFEGDDYFKYFRQRGAIIRGTAIIRGNTVSYYSLPSRLFRDNLQQWLGHFARLVTVQFTSNEWWVMMPPTQGGGRGDAPDFKWWGRSNGGKNQNPKKSRRQKLTPKKFHAKFPSLKRFQKALNDITWKIKTLEIKSLCLFIHHTVWSSYCLKYPQKSLLKFKLPVNILSKFSYPKKSRNKKFQTPKTLRSSPSLEIRSTPVPTWSPPLRECEIKIDHYAGNYDVYSLQLVCGFL